MTEPEFSGEQRFAAVVQRGIQLRRRRRFAVSAGVATVAALACLAALTLPASGTSTRQLRTAASATTHPPAEPTATSGVPSTTASPPLTPSTAVATTVPSSATTVPQTTIEPTTTIPLGSPLPVCGGQIAGVVTTDLFTYTGGQTVQITYSVSNTGGACRDPGDVMCVAPPTATASDGTVVWDAQGNARPPCPSGPQQVPAGWVQTATYSWNQIDCTLGACTKRQVAPGSYTIGSAITAGTHRAMITINLPACTFAGTLTADRATYPAGASVEITLTLRNNGPLCSYQTPDCDDVTDTGPSGLVWNSLDDPLVACPAPYPTVKVAEPSAVVWTTTALWAQDTCPGIGACPRTPVPPGVYHLAATVSATEVQGPTNFDPLAITVTEAQ